MRQSKQKRVFATAIAAALMTSASALAGGGTIQLDTSDNIQAHINSGLYAEIVLEPGSYNQSIIIDAADAPLILRSMDPSSESSVNSTILDGQFIGTSVILLTSGVGNDVVIDGLTVQNGEAITGNNRGGAIACEQASPTIRRCVLLNNHADAFGGAFYVNAGNLTIEDCRFQDNDAPDGGAAYCNNSTVNFVRCVFELNDTETQGGAVRMFNGTYTYEACDFVDNESGTHGGALASSGAMWSAWQCLFESNLSSDGGSGGRGGAIYHDGHDSSWMENCVFWNNESLWYGSSVYMIEQLTVRNCTHYGDVGLTVYDVPSGGDLDMFNSIIWNYSDGSIAGAGTKSVQYSDVQGGYAGAGNIGADSGDEPDFADAANGDFRLMAGSAGIDAGDATRVVGQYPVDYDGFPRALDDPDTTDSGLAVLGISVDMGAFEFQPADGVDPCPIDTNGDGMINVTDLLNVLSAWGSCF